MKIVNYQFSCFLAEIEIILPLLFIHSLSLFIINNNKKSNDLIASVGWVENNADSCREYTASRRPLATHPGHLYLAKDAQAQRAHQVHEDSAHHGPHQVDRTDHWVRRTSDTLRESFLGGEKSDFYRWMWIHQLGEHLAGHMASCSSFLWICTTCPTTSVRLK